MAEASPLSSPVPSVDLRRIEQAIQESLERLPPMPAVVARVMELTNDPSCSAQELQRVIGMDEVLSSRVLRLVNSARYGFPRRITTLSHAVILLGFETVRNLAIGAAAVRVVLRYGANSPVNRQHFWEHSLQTALAASALAKHSRKDLIAREEIFLAGLLHDLGILLLSQTFPEEYRLLTEECETLECAYSLEGSMFGITHSEVGARMAEQWNLPPMFVEVIRTHHSPVEGSPFFYQASTVYVGEQIAHSIGKEVSAPVTDLPPSMQALFQLDEEAWHWCRREVEMQMDSAREFLQVLHHT